MQQINLNVGDIDTLFRNRNVEFDEKKSVMLLKDDIVINDNGRLYYPDNMQMSYTPRSDNLDGNISFVQNLICEHFNLEPHQVIYLNGGGKEYDFRIALSSNNLGQISVLTGNWAMNSQGMAVEQKNEGTYIGLYRQLNNSYYYFRWFSDFFI